MEKLFLKLRRKKTFDIHFKNRSLKCVIVNRDNVKAQQQQKINQDI